VTCFLPLDPDGRLNPTRPKPWLLKTKWGHDMAFGELHLGARANRIEWSGEWEDSVTSLGRLPLKVGANVVIHDDDESSLAWTFIVADVGPA
jgi:hypothetical protein